MRSIKRFGFFSIILLAIVLPSCGGNRLGNDAAVEKLRQQLLGERFQEIYRHTSPVTREQLSEQEFADSMKNLTHELKAIDPELRWVRETAVKYDSAVFRDDNFTPLLLEKDGRQIYLQIDWAPGFELCGIATFTEINDNGKRIFRNCD